jgi:predicted dinucleotide-binding enzyme
MESTVKNGSPAEEIARLVPVSTHVVKAFDTTFACTSLDGKVDDAPLDIFLASEDAESKATIARLVELGGLHPIDAGPLKRPRQLKALGLLPIAIQSTNKLGFKCAIKIIP